MKKILFICILCGTVFSTNAQIFNIGIKGGLNYNANGNLFATISGLDFDEYIEETSHGDYGYHFGAFIELKLPLWLYLRPEIVYTHTDSFYENSITDAPLKLSINKMDFPVLVGFRIVKILRLFIGPTFQYIINDPKFDDVKATTYDDFSVGMQLGAGLEFGRFGFDVRWEKGISSSEAIFISNTIDETVNVKIDTRPNQIIFGVYWKFLKKRR